MTKRPWMRDAAAMFQRAPYYQDRCRIVITYSMRALAVRMVQEIDRLDAEVARLATLLYCATEGCDGCDDCSPTLCETE